MGEYKRYRKKPVIIHAKQLGPHEEEIIHTLEGDMHALPGDWIVVGVRRERYPIQDGIFQQTYEEVQEDE